VLQRFPDHLGPAGDRLKVGFADAIARADAVIIGSYVPDAVQVNDRVNARRGSSRSTCSQQLRKTIRCRCNSARC
jgi:hypothetical protein